MSDPFPELPAPHLPELELRFSVDFDGLGLKRILQQPSVWPWFPFADGKELEDAVALWMGFCRYRLGLTALWNGEMVGMGVLFPLPYKKMAHQTSFAIVVDPRWQRHGIGTTLLRNVMHLARERFRLEFIHADVYQGCPILHLLEKAGFQVCFSQPDYIEQTLPGHDTRRVGRLLMQRSLAE